MVKRLFGVLLALVLVLVGGAFQGSFAAGGSAPLTAFDFSIVGLKLKADPQYQAVPKGIATRVNTFFDASGYDLAAIVDKLPQDFTVRGELSGPAFQTPKTLVTRPGQPFDLPTLALLGKYTLSNIHLADGSGNVLFAAEPQAVTIESINDPLITEVKTRPLTVEELQERGVTFDSSNFDAYQFTAAIGTESGQVALNLPVLIPKGDVMYNAKDSPPPASIGLSLPAELVPVPQPDLPQNMTVSGFMLEADNLSEGGGVGGVSLPPIPGILVIPGNIGFLHQYFSALAIVTNGAPGQSNLVVKDLQVKLIMPLGDDLTPGTDAAPGDDPLRMAKGVDGFFPRELPVVFPGADGSFGTADDISLLYPAESGQADFTIEGLKEGTHKLDFEITATLEGLPIGPVALKGRATGAVLVRNPDFAVTLGHPATVRSGELYDLFVTITNTGQSIANLVSLRLDPRALSGAVFAGDEESEKLIETILPGSSATIKYRLVAQRTGKVTATAFAAEGDVAGRFILRAGVGENGIPLSPDSLILPYIGDLPSDLVNSAVGLLGQAWSVATAPTGALPATVLPISRQTVTAKANNLSETGLRLLLGDQPARAIGDLTFDLFGSDAANRGFDSLRRTSTQGLLLNQALAAVLQTEVESAGLLATQALLADQATWREAHLSLAVSQAPVHLQLSTAAGKRCGGLAAGDNYRDIPYADRLLLSDDGSARSALLLATRLEATDYTVTVKAEADALFDLGVVVPGADGMLRQLRFSGVELATGGVATLTLTPGSANDYRLKIDSDGDGQQDATRNATGTLALYDRAPQVLAATQLVPGFGPGGDEHGRTVALLFSEPVDKISAEEEANYLLDGNGVRTAYLQPGGRMAVVFLREGIGPFAAAQIAVANIVDNAGQPMLPENRPITITASGPAAQLYGTVRLADGTPVPNATVRLLQPEWVDIEFSRQIRYFIITEKTADADGHYRFDYVLQDVDGPFTVQAINAQTNEMASLTTGVTFHGQQIVLDLFMKARGSISGTVRDAQGAPVQNAQVLLQTLSDHSSYGAMADADGRFAFAGVGVGPFSLKANSQALLAEGTSMGTLGDEGGSVTADVVIYPLNSVARGDVVGRVTDSTGTARAGAVVIVSAIEGTAVTYRNWVYSGADGGFAFSNVHARDQVRVEVRDDATGERAEVTSQLLAGTTVNFNVILQGTAAVGGTVRREDQQPVTGMVVTARSGAVERYTMVAEDGTFVIAGLPLGTATLRLLDPANYAHILTTQSISLLVAGETATAALVAPLASTVTGAITGTVYKLDGSAAAGATVRLIDFYNRRYTPFKCDVAGRFEIPDLHPGNYPLAVVNGREISNRTVDLVVDGQVREVELRPFGLGSVSGVVYDEGSGMLPVGADVLLYGMQPDELGWLTYKQGAIAATKSDPQNGSYQFRDLYQGNFALHSSNIFRPIPTVFAGKIVANGDAISADLVLKDAFGSVSGQVLLPDGTPAGADIRVSLLISGAVVAVTTDESGRFAFRPIIPAKNYLLTAEDLATTLTGQTGAIVNAGRDTELTIRLLGRGNLRIKVQNGDGSVEAGAAVSVRGVRFPTDTASGSTDAQGFVTLANLSAGDYAITATGSANRGGRANAQIVDDLQTVDATLTLALYGTVTGIFKKADGLTPVAGGQITLKVGTQPIGYAISSSDPANLGAFQLDYVPLGSFSLEGYDPVSDRYGRGGGQLVTQGATLNSDVVIVARGTVKGSVLNFSGTAPIGWAAVSLSSRSGTAFYYTQNAAPDGSFVFAGVPEGLFDLRASDVQTGLKGSTEGTISFEGETRQVEVRLAASGSIEGVVRMPDGTPAVNATVSLNSSQSATVDPVDGSFRFIDLATRTYTLTAREAGTNRAGSTLALIDTDGAVARPEIKLAGIGTVEATVYGADHITPLSGATVRLVANGAISVAYTLISDANGFVRFPGVPVGSFSLTASHPDLLTGAAASGTLPAEGAVATAILPFGEIASVVGRLLLPDGTTPARDCVVRFIGTGGNFATITDSDGAFSFNDIPLCSFTLAFEDPTGNAIARSSGAMTVNGEVVDVGTAILDDRPPVVIGMTPAAGAINIPVATTEILLLFSEPVDPATINVSNITLYNGSSKISATLHLDAIGTGVRLVPNLPLQGSKLYTVTVAKVEDLLDRPMAQPFSSSFTTIDNIPPQVTSISPGSGLTQVGLDAVVRVTFSEPVDAATLGGVRLTLDGFTVPSQRDLILSQTVVVLTPVNLLLPNRAYGIVVSGVKDTAGNLLSVPLATTFNTLDTLAPSVTELQIAADARRIAGQNIEITAIVDAGDVAQVDFYRDNQLIATLSKAPFTFILPLTEAGPYYLKAIAEDKVGNRGTSTPLDFEVAADQAPIVTITAPAGGSEVDNGTSFIVTMQASDDLGLTNLTLIAGGAIEYTQVLPLSGTATEQSITLTVPYDAAPDSRIVLEAIASDMIGQLTTSVPVTIVSRDQTLPQLQLTSPGQTTLYRPGDNATVTVSATDNVGVATIDCTASGAASGSGTWNLEPTESTLEREFDFIVDVAAAAHSIVFVSCSASDASVNRADLTLELEVADVVPPQVVSSSLPDGSIDVPVNLSGLAVSFDEALAPQTVDETTVQLLPVGQPDAPINGYVGLFDGNQKVVFSLSESLQGETTYQLIFSPVVTDLDGNPFGGDPLLSFTTTAETAAPMIITITPNDGAVDVATDTEVVITFNKPVLASSVYEEYNGYVMTKIELADSRSRIYGTVSVSPDGLTATYRPYEPLAPNKFYYLTIRAGVSDEYGNMTNEAYQAMFQTAPEDVPDLLRAVYYDPSYPTAWVTRSEAEIYHNFLVANGFISLDAARLEQFMAENGPDSLVVMAQDVVSDTVATSPTDALLRDYLNRGGMVLWTQATPFYSVGHADGTVTEWGVDGLQDALGVQAGIWDLNDMAMPTADGYTAGLWGGWTSSRAVLADSVTTVLAEDSLGQAAGWFKNYNPEYPMSGFYRIWGADDTFEDWTRLGDLLSLTRSDMTDWSDYYLVAKYSADGHWYDTTTNRFDGVANNAGFTTDSQVGFAAGDLRAAGAFVDLGNLDGWLYPWRFTFEAWVNLAEYGSGSGRIVTGSAIEAAGLVAGTDFGIGLENGQFAVFSGDGTTTVSAPAGFIPNIGEWYHVVGTNEGRYLTLYVNGEAVASVPNSMDYSYTDYLYRIGNNGNCDNCSFFGLVDHIRVYYQGLTAAEAREHYLLGLSDRTAGPVTLDVTSTTVNRQEGTVTLIGSKDPDAAIIVDGSERVPVDGLRTWTATFALQPGNAVLQVVARNLQGNESAVQEVLVPSDEANLALNYDGDGMTNGQEIVSGTDPMVNGANAEFDQGALTNREEIGLGISLVVADSDGGGLAAAV